MRYLKVGVSGPYINTERTSYFEVDDDFDPDGEDFDEAQQYVADEVANYVDAWCEVVDEDEVPEDCR